MPSSRNGVGPAGQCPEVCDSLTLDATKAQHKLRWEEEIQEIAIRVAPFEESPGRTLTGLVYAVPENGGCVAREDPTWRLYGGQTFLGAHGRERKEAIRFIIRTA